ncbi:RbsD/FucU family protein [Bradyrhizobium sp. STM 3557]|uniref:RbsD/FucU family protein n=1 Tax=Bradyrhizobium sp. STM 3557 TaxID=578920 RepID=UPI00388EAC7B
MLKTIDPLLNADVLYALRAMGHGDRLVICDTNFPADSIARQTVFGELLRIDNVSAARAIQAVLSVMPLDTFVDDAAVRMEIVGAPTEVPPVQQEVQAVIDRAEGKSWPLVGVERHAFYERAKSAYCVIATGERRFYGCFLFTKGVIPPDGVESR